MGAINSFSETRGLFAMVTGRGSVVLVAAPGIPTRSVCGTSITQLRWSGPFARAVPGLAGARAKGVHEGGMGATLAP